MDSILFKLVINYYYLWNEAPKFFEKLIFKQKNQLKKRRNPHTSLPRRCYLTAEGNVCAGSSAAEIRVLDPNGLKKLTEVRISLQPYWQIDNGFFNRPIMARHYSQARSSIPRKIPNSKFEVPGYNNRNCYFMQASWMDKA